MNLSDLHPTLKQALGFFEAFRRMGFTPDEIYAAYGSLGQKGRVQIILKAQDRIFSCDAGLVDYREDEFKKRWEEASHLWNNATQEETKIVWDASYARKNATQLIMAMSGRGFVIKNNLN